MICAVDGSSMWDNTQKNAERRAEGKKNMPDYVCKANKEHIIWPPRGSAIPTDKLPETDKLAQIFATPTMPSNGHSTGSTSFKPTEYKIQKQHSQEMAIRFLDYCKKHNLEPAEEAKTLNSWTKYFLEDLEI